MNDENPHEQEPILHEIHQEPVPTNPYQPVTVPVDPDSNLAPGSPAQYPAAISGPIGSLSGQVTNENYVPTMDTGSYKKSSKWRYVFIVLGILQLTGVALFIGVMLWAGAQASAGMSGTEFLALLLFITVVPAVGIIALVNVIGLPIYMLKQKPKGKSLVLGIISLIISALLVAYAGYGAFQMFIVTPSYANDRAEQSRINAEQYKAERAKASYEISKEEAINMLQTCQLKGFYIGGQTEKDNGGWGELSSTGVVVTEVEDKPYRISVADRLVPELEPIARESQKACGWPQFSRDGRYE